MLHRSLFGKVILLGSLLCLVFALAGCSGSNYGYTGGTAATIKLTVNGEEVEDTIEEDTVTKYIQDMRKSYNITSDEDWGEWLTQNNLTPESIREKVIDYYVEQDLVRQAAQERGVTVDEAVVEEQIQTMKNNFDSDEAWKEALEGNGITEEEYRESIEQGYLKKNLQENVVGEVKVKNKDIIELINMYGDMLKNSKRSSHILFKADDEETAKKVLKQLKSGKLKFEDAVAQYSTDSGSAANGGDVGWNTLTSLVEDYTNGLDKLKKGELSGLVTSDYGIHIILCTDTYSPSGKVKSLKGVPSDIVDYLTKIVESQKTNSTYSDWFTEYKNGATIDITEMRTDLPYYIDMTAIENSEESTGEAAEQLAEDEAAAEGGEDGETEEVVEVEEESTEGSNK